MERVTARIGLVVGGASGIGAASAAALAAEGLTIAVADLHLNAAEQAAAALSGSGHRGYAADVASEDSIHMLFDAVETDLGPVAVLVVAAGTPGFIDGKRPTLRATTLDSWEQVQAINARGPFLCIREMLQRREANPVPHGRVISIASMAAQTLSANSPPAYVASKGAVFALTKVAAGEAAGLGITVNAVAPGAIATPMLRSVMPPERDAAYFGNSVAGRIGEPEDIAAAVAYLASDKADYVNGASIDVNGGMCMR